MPHIQQRLVPNAPAFIPPIAPGSHVGPYDRLHEYHPRPAVQSGLISKWVEKLKELCLRFTATFIAAAFMALGKSQPIRATFQQWVTLSRNPIYGDRSVCLTVLTSASLKRDPCV